MTSLKRQVECRDIQIDALQRQIEKHLKVSQEQWRIIDEVRQTLAVLKASGHISDNMIEAAQSLIRLNRGKEQ